MHKDLVNILACPVCKKPLALSATDAAHDEIVTGVLSCDRCSRAYPIENGIPHLLPPEGAAPETCP